MARKFVILCSEDIKKLTVAKSSTPQADPKPIVAGHVLGTYASAEVAERAILGFNCKGQHYIMEAMHFTPINFEKLMEDSA